MTDELSFLRLQARTQRFTLGTPRTFQVAPDGSRLLFLRAPSPVAASHNLYRLDVASGEEICLVDAGAVAGGTEELSVEERTLRERSRTQACGVTGYACDRECRVAAVALSGKLLLVDLLSGALRELPTPVPVIDPRPDPLGRYIGYVHAGALRLYDVVSGEDRRLAGRADEEGEEILWGLPEFLAAEEMGRMRGYWWSPDGQRLLVARCDTSAVPRWHITDPANPDLPPNVVAYPAAGTTNADVRLALVGVDGSRCDVEYDGAAFPYLTSVHWSDGGPPLLAVQSRDQRVMRILVVDVESGATSVLVEDTDEHWVDIVDGVPAWTLDGRLVRVVAADGAYRLVIGEDTVTGTDIQVRAVLDIGKQDVLFTASAEDPTQVHVYAATSQDMRRVSDAAGVHAICRGGDVTVSMHWGLSHHGVKTLVRQADRVVGAIGSLAELPPLEPEPRLHVVGQRQLRCALLLPRWNRRDQKLPVLLDPYGGPHAQRVLHARTAYVGPQWWADQGFAVLITDGRGTPGRGPEWDRAIHHEFAEVTLADQVEALQAVAAEYPDDLDMNRVAIRGWSYGGYLAALAVLRRPDVFHAAVAGAPVTDWRLYDTHYSERYLGHPDRNPEVYERNSLLSDAPKLRRPLLLIHGMADDNVFVAHTLRLSAALLAAGRQHDVLPLTGVTHMSPSDEETAENFLLLQVDWIKQALSRDK